MLLTGTLAISAAMTAFSCTSQILAITSWFGLLPLFLAVRILHPRGALLAGGFWGACLFATLSALDQSFAVSAPLSLLLLAAVPAGYAFLGAKLTRWMGFHPLLLGLGWVGLELGLEPLGLRNGLLAGTQGDGLVRQLAGGVLGYVFIAFLLALVNALLLSVLADVPGLMARTEAYQGPPASAGLFLEEMTDCILEPVRPRAQPRAPPAHL